MFTRKVRNVFVVLVLMLSVGLVPAVGAEILIESDQTFRDIVIEPDGVAFRDIVIEPDGVAFRDIVIEPDGSEFRDIVIEPDGVATGSV